MAPRPQFVANPSYLQILLGAVPYQLIRLCFYIMELIGTVLYLPPVPRGLMLERRGNSILIGMYAQIFGRRFAIDVAAFHNPSEMRGLAEHLTQIIDHYEGHFGKRH